MREPTSGLQEDIVQNVENSTRLGPFLRWVGGKRQLAAKLLTHIPEDHSERRYVEPFLGAGTIFFLLKPRKACLSDANPRLINTYLALRDSPDCVLSQLGPLISGHSFDQYYRIRAAYNACTCTSPSQAARFIYLNKACFNGIFRVNKQGQFNVPKGSKVKLVLPTNEFFRGVAAVLSSANITACDYSIPLGMAGKRDFIYLDPPYPALNGTAYFSHYTKDRFDADDQERLAEKVLAANRRGAKVLMSNADVPAIRSLYAGFQVFKIPVKRYVNCKGVRIAVGELIIRNY